MNYKISILSSILLSTLWSCSSNGPTLSYYEKALEEFYRNDSSRDKIKWNIEEPRSQEDSLIYVTLFSLLESHIGDTIPTHYHWLKSDRFYELSIKDSLQPINFMYINYYITPLDQYFQFQAAANHILSDENFFQKRIHSSDPGGVILPLD